MSSVTFEKPLNRDYDIYSDQNILKSYRILDSTSKTTHTITIPNNSKHLIVLINGGSANRTYAAIVTASSSGVITETKIATGSAYSSSSTSTNKLTITWTSASNINGFDLYYGNHVTV